NVSGIVYQAIFCIPPIRAGKKIVLAFFEGAYVLLQESGELWIVFQ
ncbi:16S rRNA methyltransferase, partial [Listeria monocytogenes]